MSHGLGVREAMVVYVDELNFESSERYEREMKWLPWHGTAYAVPQYPCSTRFFFFAPSDEKTVIGLKVGGVRPLDGKLRMSAFCRCVDWPKKRMDRPFFFDSPAPTPFQTTFCSSLSATFLTLVGY